MNESVNSTCEWNNNSIWKHKRKPFQPFSKLVFRPVKHSKHTAIERPKHESSDLPKHGS